ncbi:MAG: hypothetical protein SGI72_15960 [Planctomycetota bacterium]|nr:hypothetical protein [Planctomycetota bacterium]
MIDKDYLQLLACPETRQALEEASVGVLKALNARIARGEVKTKAGRAVATPIQAGLVRKDGKVLYPIQDRIPILLVDESILL